MRHFFTLTCQFKNKKKDDHQVANKKEELNGGRRSFQAARKHRKGKKRNPIRIQQKIKKGVLGPAPSESEVCVFHCVIFLTKK